MRALALVVLALALGGSAASSSGVRVPRGFRVSVLARGLTHPTALAWGPGGTLYATEDVGRLVAVRNGRPRLVASGLRVPLGLAFAGRTVFVSEQGRLERLRLSGGRVVSRRVLVGGLPYGEHQQDNVVVGPGRRLYVGSGSTCDACTERDARSAAILSLRMDGSGLRVVAHGLRNPYGLAVRAGRIYASVNGRDTLGRHEPAEMVVRIRSGARYGWPACWPSWLHRRLAGSCAGVARPVAYLEPHSSADGMAFWRGGLYVAEWGQYYSARDGRRVVRVDVRTGRVSTFADGFDHPLAVLAAGRALLVADWGRGIVYRIHR